MQSTDLGELVIGAIIGVVLVVTLPVIFMFAVHEPEVIAIPMFTFFVLAAVFKGIMRLLDRSDLRRMRKLQEQNELRYKQLEEARRRERALKGPDWNWGETERILGEDIVEAFAREYRENNPHL